MLYPDRPKIQLEKRPQDWVIEIASFVGVMLLIGLPILYYSTLRIFHAMLIYLTFYYHAM